MKTMLMVLAVALMTACGAGTANPCLDNPRMCGCPGVSDVDTDGDGTKDCGDLCPNDPNKIEPKACGCGEPETDTDRDGIPDCIDNCPDIENHYQEDSDGDGFGDLCDCGSDDPGVNPDAPEICDGIDNNCNDLIDEGYVPYGTGTCGVGACERVMMRHCIDGKPTDTCEPGAPSEEICSGIDDDCDGETDEDYPEKGEACESELSGPCKAGTMSCIGGGLVCVPNVQPTAEVCDGKDNDCDGIVDEDPPEPTEPCEVVNEHGTCGGVWECHGLGWKCPAPEASAEMCGDNIDNDCNGLTDDIDGTLVGTPFAGIGCEGSVSPVEFPLNTLTIRMTYQCESVDENWTWWGTRLSLTMTDTEDEPSEADLGGFVFHRDTEDISQDVLQQRGFTCEKGSTDIITSTHQGQPERWWWVFEKIEFPMDRNGSPLDMPDILLVMEIKCEGVLYREVRDPAKDQVLEDGNPVPTLLYKIEYTQGVGCTIYPVRD